MKSDFKIDRYADITDPTSVTAVSIEQGPAPKKLSTLEKIRKHLSPDIKAHTNVDLDAEKLSDRVTLEVDQIGIKVQGEF